MIIAGTHRISVRFGGDNIIVTVTKAFNFNKTTKTPVTDENEAEKRFSLKFCGSAADMQTNLIV